MANSKAQAVMEIDGRIHDTTNNDQISVLIIHGVSHYIAENSTTSSGEIGSRQNKGKRCPRDRLV